MNILILNQDWFRGYFEAQGHTVKTCGMAPHLDAVTEKPLLHIDNALKNQLDGFEPDVILVLDNSAPVIFEGLEETDIPTVFFSVDIQHHYDFHRYLYHVFDHTFVAQKDYIPFFEEVGGKPEWMPLWAPRHIEASAEKKWGAVFVGNMDAELNPDRVEFFNALKEKVDVYTTTGQYWDIFPHADIVVNQTVKGDLNFRVFEAMMCGSALLTEMSGNGLTDLFEPGTHLITYEKGNIEEAASQINELLANKERCRSIAKAGRDEILKNHTEETRAKRVLEVLTTVQKKRSPIVYFSWMKNYHVLSTKLHKIDTGLARQAIICCAKAAENAMKAGEPIDEELANSVVHACFYYDQELRTGAGADLLKKLYEHYPDVAIIGLGYIRNLLNSGKIDEATVVARKLGPHKTVEEMFQGAETVVRQLLELKIRL